MDVYEDFVIDRAERVEALKALYQSGGNLVVLFLLLTIQTLKNKPLVF